MAQFNPDAEFERVQSMNHDVENFDDGSLEAGNFGEAEMKRMLEAMKNAGKITSEIRDKIADNNRISFLSRKIVNEYQKLRTDYAPEVAFKLVFGMVMDPLTRGGQRLDNSFSSTEQQSLIEKLSPVLSTKLGTDDFNDNFDKRPELQTVLALLARGRIEGIDAAGQRDATGFKGYSLDEVLQKAADSVRADKKTLKTQQKTLKALNDLSEFLDEDTKKEEIVNLGIDIQNLNDDLSGVSASQTLAQQRAEAETFISEAEFASKQTAQQSPSPANAGPVILDAYGRPSNAPTAPDPAATKIDQRQVVQAKANIRKLDEMASKSKELTNSLKGVLDNLANASGDDGIGIGDEARNALSALQVRLRTNNVSSDRFSALELLKIKGEVLDFVEAQKTVIQRDLPTRVNELELSTEKLQKDMKLAKEGLGTWRNKADGVVAKRLLVAMLGEQFPDMSERKKEAKATELFLKYRKTATTPIEDQAQELASERERIVDKELISRYIKDMFLNDGEKDMRPLSSFKEEIFTDVDSLKKALEANNVLNMEQVYYALYAFRNLEEKFGKRFQQTRMLEEKAFTMMAEKLEVSDKLDNAKVVDQVAKQSSLLFENYKAAIEGNNSVPGAYIDHKASEDSKKEHHKLQALIAEHDKLAEKTKIAVEKAERAKNDAGVRNAYDRYNRELTALRKKAEEAHLGSVFNGMIQDEIVSDFGIAREFSEGVKNQIHSITSYIGDKAKALGSGILDLGKNTAIGAGLSGGELALRLGAAPIYSLKWIFYDKMIKKRKLGSVALEYFKKPITRLGSTIKGSAKAIPGKFKEPKKKAATYEERSEFDDVANKELIDYHEAEAKPEAYKMAFNPFSSFDFSEAKASVQELLPKAA